MIATLFAAALYFTSGAPGDVTIVRQPDPAASLIGTQVVLQAGVDRQSPEQNGLAALAAESVLQTLVESSASLAEAVSAAGGSISYVIEPRDVRFYLEGLPDSYAQLLTLFRSAIDKPDFSPLTIARARDALQLRITALQTRPLDVGITMLNRSFYENSDAGMPPYGLPATLAAFSSSDAQSFYQNYYRRGGAFVSTAGTIDSVSSDLFAELLAGLRAGSSEPYRIKTTNRASLTRQIIARRDVSVSWLVAQYPAPQLSSRDFGSMLVLTALVQRTLSDVSGGQTIATQSAALRGVGTLYNFDAQPSNVILYVNGEPNDSSRAFATALTIVNVLGHTKLEGNLDEVKSYALGRYLQGTATLEQRARLAEIFASQHISGDYVSTAIAAIRQTTAGDVQRVALRYLGDPTIALVLPRGQLPDTSP